MSPMNGRGQAGSHRHRPGGQGQPQAGPGFNSTKLWWQETATWGHAQAFLGCSHHPYFTGGGSESPPPNIKGQVWVPRQPGELTPLLLVTAATQDLEQQVVTEWWHQVWGPGNAGPQHRHGCPWMTVRACLLPPGLSCSTQGPATPRGPRVTQGTPFTKAASTHLGPQFLGSRCAWDLEAKLWSSWESRLDS